MFAHARPPHLSARFATIRRCLLLFLLLTSLPVVARPAATQDDDTAPPFDKRLALQLDAPKDELAPGNEALVTLTATNAGTVVIEAVSLHLHDTPGVAWSDDFKGPWLELGDLAAGESRVIEGRARVAGWPADGALSLFATLHGHDVAPATATADLFAPPPPPEEVAVAQEGSVVDAAAGRVRFTFPADWHESDARLTFQLQEQYRQAAGETGRLLLFSVEATADSDVVDSFDAPATVAIDLSDLIDPEWAAERPPVVTTRQSEKENWTAVESTFEPKTGLLTFTTSHFSSYQVTTEPELWRLLYNPPGVSAYSGAATYQYALELPPGIGGLTPELTLNYSSRPAEGMRAPAMGQGFGAGWGLPQAQINSRHAGYFYTDDEMSNKGYDANSFTLVLNGMNYYLNPVDTTGRYGTFHAIGSPDLYIEYVEDNNGTNETANVSGEFWRVRTPDGTTYTFGQTEDAEQVIWPMEVSRNQSQPRNEAFAPYNWKLNSVVDVHGNRIDYVYDTACGVKWAEPGDREAGIAGGGKECTEVDTGVKEIRYNYNGGTAQTTVLFNNELRNYHQRRQEKSMTAGVFRPVQITIKQDNTVVARYDFTYAGGAHYVVGWDVSVEYWMLTSIAHWGYNGTVVLPFQTFAYNRDVSDGCVDGSCVRLLTEVANGYGAVTVLSYANWGGTRWQTVTQSETWDGVAHKKGAQAQGQTRTVYNRSEAAACFDTAGSACAMGTAPPSEALVGFDKVTIDTQRPTGGSSWQTVARSKSEFRNDDYLLLGKTNKQQQLDPDNGNVLAEDVYTWDVAHSADGEYILAQLLAESHTLASSLGSSVAYTYVALNPAGGSYGALQTKQEKDETGGNFRCTEYAYKHLTTGGSWLINRPIRETVKSPGCDGAKAAETLYRYAGSTKPAVNDLDTRALLTYVMRWVSGTDYVLEKRTYETNGVPAAVITYSNMIAFGANNYNLTERNRTTYTYTGNTLGLPTQIVSSGADATSRIQWLNYDVTFHWLVDAVTDGNLVSTYYRYDPLGRLSLVALPGDLPTDPTVRYEYYDDSAPLHVSPLLVETSYKNGIRSAERAYYDGLGRLVQNQTDNANVHGVGNKDLVVTTAYDARGLAVCQTAPYFVGANTDAFQSLACDAANNPHTTTAYDRLGRATSVTTPDGVTTTTGYTIATNITVDGHARFLRTTSTDGNGHAVNRLSDVFGRLVLVRELTGSNPYTAYADTRYSYDVLGNLTAVGTSEARDSQPSGFLRRTVMTYDGLGRKLTMDDPDMGDWAYDYNTAGNLRWQQAPGNLSGSYQAICFYSDNLNRPIQRLVDDAPGDKNCPLMLNRFDLPNPAPSHLASIIYGGSEDANNIGQVVEVKWGATPNNNKDTYAYEVDDANGFSRGRLLKQTRLVNNQTFIYEIVQYDALDRPTQAKLPGGEVVVTAYDKEGANTLTAGATQLIDDVGYNERGQLVFLGRQGSTYDTTFSYLGATGNFRLDKILHGAEGGALPDFLYGAGNYDAAGHLTGMQMKLTSGTDTYHFGYDELNRLTTASLSGAAAANYSYTYEYDRLGNITSRMGTDPYMSYSYGAGSAGPQAVTGIEQNVGDDLTFTYDTRGNMATKAKAGVVTHLYTFDKENLLTSVTTGNQTMSFAYDADGQRVMTTRHDGTILYTPFPDYEVEDPLGSGANTTRTTYRIAGQIVAIQFKIGTQTGEFNYTYTDHLGNVAALSTTAGAYISNSLARYDPFGNFRTTPSGVNPSRTSHGFTGHKHNNTGGYPTQNVGLIYMNARYYLPEVGRFVSPDSIVPDPTNPQSYNRYAYSYNNPINYTDPSGHMANSGCGEYVGGCTLDDELDPNHTYINNDNSPVLADPMLLEQYPAEFTAGEAAYTVAGLATIGFAPIAIEGMVAAWPLLASGGSVACADSDCTNEFNFAKETGNRVFWSGRETAKAAAEMWAKSNDAVTINMTSVGQRLDQLTKSISYQAGRPIWERASAEFARGASGEVHVFQQESGVFIDSIWAQIEYQILGANPNVTSIIYHVIMGGGTISSFP